MVAITVVLAAVVFVLVSNLGGESESAPAISFSRDEGNDRIEVVSAASNADWNRLAVQATSGTTADATGAIVVGTATPYQNDAAVAGGGEICQAAGSACAATQLEVTATLDAVGAGDYLEFCASNGAGANGSGAASNVVIQIIDTTANQKVGEFTFLSIAACA